MIEWKDLNPDQRILELKRQRAILDMAAEFSYQDQQALLSRAREVIKKLSGQKFAPAEIEEDIGINQQALIIEAKKAGYEESKDTRDLVPPQYVTHVYELSEVAKSERFISNLQKENEELRAEIKRLSESKPARKTTGKRRNK